MSELLNEPIGNNNFQEGRDIGLAEIEIQIRDRKYNVLCDSGSQVTLINQLVYENLKRDFGPELIESPVGNISLVAATGAKFKGVKTLSAN